MTLRELNWMMTGRLENQRAFQADLMALIWNCHSRKPIKPSDVYPDSSNRGDISAKEMGDLIRETFKD